MKQRNYRWFIIVALLALWGCPSLGVVQPQSFDERLAYAYGANTAVREASTGALNAGTISSEDMEYVLDLNNQVRAGLNMAKAAQLSGDMQSAESRLLLTVNVLTQLQAYLRTKGVSSKLEGEFVWA